MECLHPLVIRPMKNEEKDEWKELRKRPATDPFRRHFELTHPEYSVPCGKCVACHSNRREQWALRIHGEFEVSESALFITWTFDDDHLPHSNVQRWYCSDGSWILINDTWPAQMVERIVGDRQVEAGSVYAQVPGFDKKGMQKYLKRLRFEFDKKGISLRYFICSEYGPQTLRPHYHGIFFFKFVNGWTEEQDTFIRETIAKQWHYSKNFPVIDSNINPSRCMYLAKYCLKETEEIIEKLAYEKPFILTSRQPGLGVVWFMKNKHWYLESDDLVEATNNYTWYEGRKVAIPRLMRDKLGLPKADIPNILYDFNRDTNSRIVYDFLDDFCKARNIDPGTINLEEFVPDGFIEYYNKRIESIEYIKQRRAEGKKDLL